VSWDNPVDAYELSRARYEEALSRVEAVVQLADSPELLNEVRIIRMVGMNRAPWWGQGIDHEDSSVTVGVMMRNAFEAVGDYIDYPTDQGLKTDAGHWLTRRYLPLWRQGKREYQDWLDTLFGKRRVDSPAG
jgi:hypothetical protein